MSEEERHPGSLESLTAEELMIPLDKYPHIPYWFTLRQAIVELENSEIEIGGRKSLPRVVLVFDEKYRLMGMARRRDILKGLEPHYLTAGAYEGQRKLFDVEVDANLSDISREKLLNHIKQRAESPVGEFMTPIARTVEHGDNIIKIIDEMVKNDLDLLPVMKDDKVAGVVRSVDVFHNIARWLL
jgi:predicted transcriptional regulator